MSKGTESTGVHGYRVPSRGDATKAASCAKISVPARRILRIHYATLLCHTGLHYATQPHTLDCSDTIKAIYRLNVSSSTPQWARHKLQ